MPSIVAEKAGERLETTRIEQLLIQRIAALGQGDRLQTERELALELNVGRTVLRGVLGQLEERGVISRQRRVGTVVNPDALHRLLPAVYVGRKDPNEMAPGSPRRLRNELNYRLTDELAGKVKGFRVVPVPHEHDHRRLLASGRPTVAGGGGIHLPDAVAFGVCADLTERVRQWPVASEFWPNLWEAVTLNGCIYGLPGTAHVFILVANVDCLRRAGLSIHDLPSTWDELRLAALRLQRDGGCRQGLAIGGDHRLAWLFEDLCYQAGGCTIDGGGDRWQPALNSAPVVTALEWLRQLAWEDGVLLAAPTGATAIEAVVRGECGLAIVESSSFFNDVVWHGYPTEIFRLGPLPAGPHGHRLCQVSVLMDFINAGAPAEEQDAAWRWLAMLRTPASMVGFARAHWEHRLVTGWPPIFRHLSHADTGIGLPVHWLNTVQDIMARARPQPAGHGWDLEIYLRPVLRRILADSAADPRLELETVQRLVRPGMRFLH